MKSESTIHRRRFLQSTTLAAIGIGSLNMFPLIAEAHSNSEEDINLIRPLEGYSPNIGILVSMLNWNRASVVRTVKGLSQSDLDFLVDDKSNSIGALLLHLAATDVIYQDLTFYNQKEFSEANAKKWSVPMGLGDEARRNIKGNNLDYYLSALSETREKTLAELKKRDDKWFAEIDPQFFDNKPTNNFCKWFHVCEHESNHRGQMAVIKKRIPGSNSKGE